MRGVMIATPMIRKALTEIERNDDGIILKAKLTGAEYKQVSKFLEACGLVWNKKKKQHICEKPDAFAKLDELLENGSTINEDKFNQFHPTPANIAEELVRLAGVSNGTKCLEPSAGEGSIARAMAAAGGLVTCVEIDEKRAKSLAGFDLRIGDFLEMEFPGLFDCIVMNPPFSMDMDISHVMKAYDLLFEGGRLVAIVSPRFQYASTKKAVAFRDFFKKADGVIHKELEPFGGSGVKPLVIKLTVPSF